MARLLYLTDATPFCVRTALRHIHLCNQTKGCEQFGTTILPVCRNLQDKRKISDDADEKCSFSLDLVHLREREVDDTIRSGFNKCKDYDNEHAGENVLNAVFPTRTFSEFVSLPYVKKPAEAKLIAQRFEHLGATHALYPQTTLLGDRTTSLEQALVADKTAKDALKKATGDEGIARTELMHAYENNYLDARKFLGNKQVEKIFPVINHNNGDDETDPPAANPPKA